MSPDMQSIAQRLEELEKQVAHLEALIIEQSDPDKPVATRTIAAGTIVAQTFVVRDEKWQARAEFGMKIRAGQTEPQPYLGLFDASERLRACIHVDGEGPSVELFSAKGKELVELSEHPEGPRIILLDPNGSPRIFLGVDNASDRGSCILLYSPNGKQNVRLDLLSSGQASLTIQAPNGESRALLAVTENGEASLVLLKDSNVGWTAP